MTESPETTPTPRTENIQAEMRALLCELYDQEHKLSALGLAEDFAIRLESVLARSTHLKPNIDTRESTHPTLKAGDRVEVIAGVYKGRSGVVERANKYWLEVKPDQTGVGGLNPRRCMVVGGLTEWRLI